MGDYCRQLEAYLCRKNDGHLIRIVGPSFELVSRWETEGIPLKIAREGIDRYSERYYRKGPRRRPVRIDFCDADVRDVFDEWRRAIGLPGSGAGFSSRTDSETASEGSETAEAGAHTAGEPTKRGGPSLPRHLERVALALTNARATSLLPPEAESVLDAVGRELDAARSTGHGLRGDSRRALLERLVDLDRQLMEIVAAGLPPDRVNELTAEAKGELEAFRSAMPAGAYQRAEQAAFERLLRERFRLPLIRFE